MLRYLARSLPLALRAGLRRSSADPVSRISRRVWPNEIDINLHMNQAVYAEVLELGRIDWAIRSGGWQQWRREQVKPVVAEQRVIYRRELKPLQRYIIDTRAIGFDGRLMCIEGHVLVNDRVHAKSEAKLIFIGADGVISAEASQKVNRGQVTEALAVTDWRVVLSGS